MATCAHQKFCVHPKNLSRRKRGAEGANTRPIKEECSHPTVANGWRGALGFVSVSSAFCRPAANSLSPLPLLRTFEAALKRPSGWSPPSFLGLLMVSVSGALRSTIGIVSQGPETSPPPIHMHLPRCVFGVFRNGRSRLTPLAPVRAHANRPKGFTFHATRLWR